MDRMSLDLGTARNNFSITMNRWRYLFVGECTGDATIKLGSPSASGLDPNEFEKLTDIGEYRFLFITNTAQAGEDLNIYYEEEKTVETEIKG
jgi:hypothetical protein